MKSTVFRYLFVLVGTFASLSACQKKDDTPPATPFKEIDAKAAGVLKNNNLMGMAVAVVKDDRLVWSKGYGLANLATNIPATDESIFLIASISKTVTAVAAMQLVEQGRIGLDTDINQYLPFRVVNPKNPAGVITCRQLMTNTSGIVDAHYNSVAFPALYSFGTDPTLSLADFCRAFFLPGGQYYSPNSFLAAAPGARYDYSNVGNALLGYVVEAVSGKPFYQQTQETIFAPLGMSKTSWRLQSLPLAELAMPYSDQNTAYGHYTFADYPDGCIRTSAKDLSKFLRAMMMGGASQGQRILREASVAELLRIQFPNLPDASRQALVFNQVQLADFGLPPTTQGPTSLMGHAGGEKGVFTLMYFDPITRAGAIIFTNKDLSTQDAAQSIAELEYALVLLAQAN